MTEYADLTIELSRLAENQYWVRLSYSQPDGQIEFAPESGQTTFDFDALRASALKPETYGQLLREVVFPSEALRSFVKNCYTRSAQFGRELRTRVMIDRSALELHNLRWETIHGLDDQGPLSTDSNRPFSRLLATSDVRRGELRSRGRLRALVVIASPDELNTGMSLGGQVLVALDVNAEAQRAVHGMREAPQAHGIHSIPEITFLADPSRLEMPSAGRASLENLHAHLLQGYDIVYLVAHGALLPNHPENTPNILHPYMLLEKDDGSYDRCPGQDLITAIASLPMAKRPRLIVLASCQSGGQGMVPDGSPDGPGCNYDEGALAALGPRLAEVGIPAVLAMQDDVRMSSIEIFMPLFFSQLLEHGQVDKAVAVARQALIQAKAPDWWVPVLYLRLLGGLLWFNPGFTRIGDFEGWNGIINSLEQRTCVPILGFGLLEPLIGNSREIARSWAESAGYPLEPHTQYDLTQVAQYLSIKHGLAYPRDQLIKHIYTRLSTDFGISLQTDENRPLGEKMDVLLSQIADQVLQDPEQPFNILARLPCKVYINANPDKFLEIALHRYGRKPVVMYSRWKHSLEDNETILASRRKLDINVDRPLIYYLFGKIDLPKSLVLSEDDYFEYLMWINNSGAKIRPPNDPVFEAWRNDALLFLGFQLEDWSFRALFRSILYGDRRRSIREYPSVAVQLQPGGGYLNAESARRYLAKTFQTEFVDIYWGSGDDFLSELNRQYQFPRQYADPQRTSEGGR